MNLKQDIDNPDFSFSQPATYQIKVLGRVPQSWSGRLSNMTVTYHETDEQLSILTGLMRDQSALSGVLNALYDMHMSVLSVKKIKEK